jgi:dTDP-4-amino-4,6-dideoxygalactose transaminase
MSYRIPLNASTLEAAEINAAKDVIDSGMMTMGKRCIEFEDAFAQRLGVRNAIMVNSDLVDDDLAGRSGRRRAGLCRL